MTASASATSSARYYVRSAKRDAKRNAESVVLIEKLSARQIEALEERLHAAQSAVVDECIAYGWGDLTGAELRTLAESREPVYPLARRYVAATAAWMEAVDEIARRRRYSGTLKPIKRQSAY